jgi:hypothetical protein
MQQQYVRLGRLMVLMGLTVGALALSVGATDGSVAKLLFREFGSL